MHKRSVRFIFCALLLFALAVAIGAAIKAHAASADNNIVGTWTTTFPPTADTSAARLFLRIRPDGSYTMYSASIGAFSSAQGQYEGTYASAGTFTVTPNHFRMVAKTIQYTDGGTYRLEGRKYLYLTGKLGTGKWTRVMRSPYFPEHVVNGDRVPMDVPLIVRAVVAQARKHGYRDAIPTQVSVIPQGTDTYGVPYCAIEVDVASPARGTGWRIYFMPYAYRVRRFTAASPTPLAAKFVDLPKAIETARQHGFRGPLQVATLMDWQGWGTIWFINGPLPNGTAPHAEVLASGAMVPPGHGPLTQAAAAARKQDNAQWNKAIANFRAMLSQATGRPGGTHCPPGGLPGIGGTCVYIPPVSESSD